MLKDLYIWKQEIKVLNDWQKDFLSFYSLYLMYFNYINITNQYTSNSLSLCIRGVNFSRSTSQANGGCHSWENKKKKKNTQTLSSKMTPTTWWSQWNRSLWNKTLIWQSVKHIHNKTPYEKWVVKALKTSLFKMDKVILFLSTNTMKNPIATMG